MYGITVSTLALLAKLARCLEDCWAARESRILIQFIKKKTFLVNKMSGLARAK